VLNSYFHDNRRASWRRQHGQQHGGPELVVRAQRGGRRPEPRLYVGQIASLSVDGSTFADQVLGNQLKSRAAETTVSNSHFSTGPDGANYDVDLPNGGVAYIHDNTFDKGETSDNRAIIHFGGEIDNPSGSLLVEHNNFSSNLEHTTAVLNQTDLPVQVIDNALTGVENIVWGSGTWPAI